MSFWPHRARRTSPSQPLQSPVSTKYSLHSGAAEVFGDYGVGPSHTLLTGGSARSNCGLSVFHFLAIRTRLDLSPTPELIADTARLATLEGLDGHAQAVLARTF